MSQKLFKKDATYENIKEIIQEKLTTYYNNNTKDLVQDGVFALVLLKDNKRVVSFSKRVDEIYTKENLEKQKLPTILCGMILLYSCKDFTAQLSDDALALFSHNLAYCYSNMEEIQKQTTFTTPNILETICTKTKNPTKRDSYYAIAETLYINANNQSVESKENNICQNIRNMDNTEFERLNQNCFDYKEVEELSKKAGIRI